MQASAPDFGPQGHRRPDTPLKLVPSAVGAAPLRPDASPAPTDGAPTLEIALERQALLPLDAAMSILSDVAADLDALASEGFGYGALSPSTILLGAHGRARLVPPEIAGRLRPGYAAPEQRAGGMIGVRVDQYALGIVAYELLSGQRRESRLADTGLEVINEVEIAPTRVLRPGLGPSVNEVLHRATLRDPQWRYESAGAFVEALGAAVRRPMTAEQAIDEETIARVVAERESREHRTAALRENRGSPLLTVLGYGAAVGAVVAATWLGGRAGGPWDRLWTARPASVVNADAPAEFKAAGSGAPNTTTPTSAASNPASGAAGQAAATSGYLRVDAGGAAAMILVDGRPMGTAPAVLRLSSGAHEVRLVLPGRTFSPATAQVRVGSSDTTSATFALR